jgi:hypothetical protein
MLSVVGALADGWLPSLSYLRPGDLANGNKVIDEAAQRAGRTPGDVRRLLNINGRFAPVGRGTLDGPAEQWAEELAEVALSDGVSTFILGTDDPADLRRFAAEVAPAVRELVEAERAPAERGPAGRAPAGGVPAPPEADRPAVPTGAFTVMPTPDDGRRRTSVRVWDESTRPHGPAADPGRTYDAHQQANAQHLIDVHDHFRAELAQLHDLIEQVTVGLADVAAARSHINTMTMRQHKWTLGTYCESYCRVVTTHHTLEDRAMFPHLRRGDARLGPVLDRLEQEHRAIHDVIEGVDRALVAFVATPDGMAQLRAAVDLLADTLLSHLSYEERELVEPIARLGLT